MNNIKAERKKLSMTQKQLADAYNQFLASSNFDAKPVSYAAVSRWESEENEPNSETWNALASFFEVSPAYLRGESLDRVTDNMVARKLVNELEFSEDSQKNKKIRENLIEIFENLIFRMDELQSQIDEINDPYEYDDEGNQYPKH